MKLAYQILNLLILKFIFRSRNINKEYGKDSWALVTGCTEGIGEAFVYELAKLNFNVILVSRNQQKLEQVEKKIQVINDKIKTKIIVADFSTSTETIFYDNIYQQFKDLDISLLINNVGIGDGGQLHKLTDFQIKQIILVNTYPIVFLTQKCLPNMLKRQNRSGIINLGSFLSECPGPYLQTYSATKAFDDFFTRAIQIEYGNQLDILCLKPNGVLTTKTSKMKIVGAITSEDCAKSGLQKLGQMNETSGHWKHCLQKFVMSFLPAFIQIRIMAKVNLDIWNKYNQFLEKQKNEGLQSLDKKRQ